MADFEEPQVISPGKSISMLIYGVPGAGKSRLIGTRPETLIIHPPTDHLDSIEEPDNVKQIEVTTLADLEHAFQWGQQGGFAQYEWVWLDSISLLEEYGLDDVFQAAIDRKPARAEFGPDKQEYGLNRSRLTKFLRDMVGLSKAGMFNFGVTANVMPYRDPIADEDLWVPSFGSTQTNLHAKLASYVNIVAYLKENRKKEGAGDRFLITDADGFIGKDQFHCFPELKSGRHGFKNPSMADIEAAVEKARRKRKSAPAATRKRRPAKRRARK